MNVPANQPHDFPSDPKSEELLVKNVQAYLQCLHEGIDPDSLLTNAWHQFERACSFCLRRLADFSHVSRADVDDVVQAVWTEVVRRLPKFRWCNRLAFRAWLGTIVRRQAASSVRDKCRHPAQSLGSVLKTKNEPLARGEDPTQALIRRERCELVRIVLAKLRTEVTDLNFQVFYQHYFEERTIPEVAANLRLTEGQTWDRLHRMIEKFRTAWKPYSDEDFGTSPDRLSG